MVLMFLAACMLVVWWMFRTGYRLKQQAALQRPECPDVGDVARQEQRTLDAGDAETGAGKKQQQERGGDHDQVVELECDQNDHGRQRQPEENDAYGRQRF